MEEQSANDINSIKNNPNNNDDLYIKNDKEKKAVELIKKIHETNPELIDITISKIGNDQELRKVCYNIEKNVYDIADVSDTYKKNIEKVKSRINDEYNEGKLENYLIRKTMIQIIQRSCDREGKFSMEKFEQFSKKYQTDFSDTEEKNFVDRILHQEEREIIDYILDNDSDEKSI